MFFCIYLKMVSNFMINFNNWLKILQMQLWHNIQGTQNWNVFITLPRLNENVATPNSQWIGSSPLIAIQPVTKSWTLRCFVHCPLFIWKSWDRMSPAYNHGGWNTMDGYYAVYFGDDVSLLVNSLIWAYFTCISHFDGNYNTRRHVI